MADIFDKVVKGIGTGVDAVGSKTKELWDTTMIKARIGDLKVDRRKVMEELGDISYTMLIKNAFNFEKLQAKAAEITEIDRQISEAEKELEEIRDAVRAENDKSHEDIEPETTDVEGSSEPEVDDIPENRPEEASEKELEEEQEEACENENACTCECGASIVPGARYCISCGRPVSSECKCE